MELEQQQTTTSQQNVSVLITAAIFFSLGFVIAYLVFGSSGTSGEGDVEAAVNATFTALTPPPPEAVTDYNPTIGPSDAPVTMIEFSDYTCVFCGQFHRTTLEPLMEHYGDLVQFVYKEFPRSQAAIPLGVAAQCASAQGKYWDYTDLLWNNQIAIDPLPYDDNTLVSFAQQTNLNVEEFNTCRSNQTIQDQVLADRNAGLYYNVTGTPTYIINGQRFVGANPIEDFMDLIDSMLLEKGIAPPERAS